MLFVDTMLTKTGYEKEKEEEISESDFSDGSEDNYKSEDEEMELSEESSE